MDITDIHHRIYRLTAVYQLFKAKSQNMFVVRKDEKYTLQRLLIRYVLIKRQLQNKTGGLK